MITFTTDRSRDNAAQAADEVESRRRFGELTARWKAETRFQSSTTAIAMNPAYQSIIAMGPRVLPLILRELRDQPDHWFWALHTITGEDPAHSQATFRGAVEAWLQWGREHGYLL